MSVQPPDQVTAPRVPTRAQEPEPAAPRAAMPVAWLSRFARWEVLLIGLLIGVLVYKTRYKAGKLGMYVVGPQRVVLLGPPTEFTGKNINHLDFVQTGE